MRLLATNGLKDIQYVEPYAGGASLALSLLFEGYAATIHINDLSRPVYAFWHSVLSDTDELCRRIESTKITIEEWHRQREVYAARQDADLVDLGFAAFFLNRANRSGIIAGGVIGGKGQTGKWALDARFTKDELIRRIRRIGHYRNRIRLYHQDALDFTKDVLPALKGNVFAFFDPPYIEKGAQLYLNNYTVEDHRALAARVVELEQPWVVTYDYEASVRHGLYAGHRRLAFELSYSAQDRHGGKEAMFLSKGLSLPLSNRGDGALPMSPYGSRYPVYATVDGMSANPVPRRRRESRAQ
jgi:DNA adenine methylase